MSKYIIYEGNLYANELKIREKKLSMDIELSQKQQWFKLNLHGNLYGYVKIAETGLHWADFPYQNFFNIENSIAT